MVKKKEERYKVLISAIEDLFSELGVRRISSKTVLSLWQNAFRENASQRNYILTKESMIWPIIAISCDANESDQELDKCDSSDVSEILHRYRDVINNDCERFEFISRILSDYNDFYPELSSSERTRRFISERWEHYKDDFDLKYTDSALKEKVICLTISKVLSNRNTITSIKRVVKL